MHIYVYIYVESIYTYICSYISSFLMEVLDNILHLFIVGMGLYTCHDVIWKLADNSWQ